MSRKKHTAHRKARPGAVQVSRARKQCEALGARLAVVGAELAAWDRAREEATLVYRTRLVPLHLSFRRRLRALVLQLDDMHRRADLDDDERDILSELIADMASDLLDADEEYGDEDEEYGDEDEEYGDEDDGDDDEADPELSAIYERHHGAGADDAAEFSQRVDQVHGEEEELAMARLFRVRAGLDQYEARQAANTRHLRQAVDALAVELKAALEGAVGIGDAVRRERLQCVDDAHARGMLGVLVELGFAFEQEGIIGHISEKRVAEYKLVLKEWLQLCEQELVLGKGWTLLQLDLEVPPEQLAALTPADLLDMLDTTADLLREDLAGVERDLAELRDPHKLKAWLRALEAGGAP